MGAKIDKMNSNTLQLLAYAIPALLIAISLHEMMHSVVGYWLGDDTAKSHGRLSFNPVRHIDPLTTIALPVIMVMAGLPPFAAARPVPINTARLKFEEFGMAMVALAGPLTNLLIAIVVAIIIKLFNPSGWLQMFLLVNVSVNVGLCIFNLIPFPPLDGSRLLYALVPEVIQDFMMKIERFGLGAIFFFILVIFPIISPAITRAQQVLITFLLS